MEENLKSIKDKVKIVFIDLDNTLVHGGSDELNLNTRRVLNKILEKGIYVVISTGRNFERAKPVINQLKKSPYLKYVITSNGGKITKLPKEEVVYSKFISIELLDNLLNYLYDENILYKFSFENIFYGRKINFLMKFAFNNFYFNKNKMKLENTIRRENVEYEKINKVLIFSGLTSKTRKNRMKYIKDNFDNKFNCVTGGNNKFYELTEKPISKGYAANKIIKALGIDRENTLAMGDSLNDLELLKFVKYSFSPPDSEREILKTSEYQMDKASNDGVSKVLEEIFL